MGKDLVAMMSRRAFAEPECRTLPPKFAALPRLRCFRLRVNSTVRSDAIGATGIGPSDNIVAELEDQEGIGLVFVLWMRAVACASIERKGL